MSLIKPAIKDALNKLGYDIRRTPPKEAKIKLLDSVSRELQKIEQLAGNLTRSEVLKKLRALSLSDFGLFMLSIPNPDFPKLSAVLPRMAKKEAQIGWTGTSGVELLTQTVDFVRSLAYNFTRATGRPLEHANILDFGCGYGRITRMMYYFSGEDQVYAVDPWDKSIETCRADGLTQNFSMSEYLPSTLPVPSSYFDLIFAFSVFTHLSERATFTCLNTISDYLKPDGLIAITIRPVEYWDVDPQARRLNLIDQQKEKHNQQGFSFLPHDRPPVDGDITYGDTSVSSDWLKGSFPKLKIAAVDRSLSDPYQMYVFLRKRSAGNQE
jgi:2-polyprenyl-3-methyl-5-hydroxy-6-metoxy-1,4-benzoquinol methylase